MLALLKTIIKPVHCHPKRAWYEWQQPFDPMLADLQANEHGIVRRIDAQMVHENGLILDYEGDGPINLRVN